MYGIIMQIFLTAETLKWFSNGNFKQTKTANTDAGAFVFAVLRLLMSCISLKIQYEKLDFFEFRPWQSRNPYFHPSHSKSKMKILVIASLKITRNRCIRVVTEKKFLMVLVLVSSNRWSLPALRLSIFFPRFEDPMTSILLED